ncbi:unnamed protein product [Adineta steineri]|uniref:ADP ribosyltransferase domain-containing protein n=1 Tax=Adineta steineri TaxID=433720 RepID=A0A815B917_9BILA|nr:unnamed protein product [Adineta steineri]CAF1399459.1 unnamed protein product [Adineta steineri]CAF1412748.1 unnamed protein product [Adineta steineri]CAF1412779.1 unnamed protein product [Adineta steineri]CAF1450821.1 unnamed protein product [Adineta steineri]
MDTYDKLLELSKEQHRIFENLVGRLFDKSIEGLYKTLNEINNLKLRHLWYHSNIYQIRNLKSTITDIQVQFDQNIRQILNEIEEQKKYAKEIFFNLLNQLESTTTINAQEIRQHLNELFKKLDFLTGNISNDVFLMSIFSSFGFMGMIAAILLLFTGGSIITIATLGLGAMVTTTVSEIMFHQKLSELDEKLRQQIGTIKNNRSEQIQNLNHYYQSFEKQLHHNMINGQTSAVNIIWYDQQIKNDSNQNCFEGLRKLFSTENYQTKQFNEKTQLLEFIRSNPLDHLILITSGSSGKDIISQIGYYSHIKGIIIYCSAVAHHQEWADNCKKVLLVANSFNEVIQKIRDIENGEIYFLKFGFSFEDINLKLKNSNYFLSTKRNHFIITNFSEIDLNIDYHQNRMRQLHKSLESKNIFSDNFPYYFQIDNLYLCAQKFIEALKKSGPEKNIIRLYTSGRPFYYQIINDILSLLDQELILLIQDYIKALRYSLMIYSDTSKAVPNTKNVKLYRGLNLNNTKNFEEFLKKFKINDTIVFPAFTSTSLNEGLAESFAGKKGVLLEISADCTQSNKPKSVRELSHYQNEDEVLLNCFSLLTVKNITKRNDCLMLYQCNLELC